MELEEADNKEDESVGADSPVKHLVQISLRQELLQNQNQFGQNGVLVDEVDDDFNPFHPGRSVETDVHFDLRLLVGELYDGHRRLVDGVDGILDGDVGFLQLLLQSEDGGLGPVTYHHEVYVTSREKQTRHDATEHVDLGLRPLPLENLRNPMRHLQSHPKLRGSRGHVLEEIFDLLVEAHRVAVVLSRTPGGAPLDALPGDDLPFLRRERRLAGRRRVKMVAEEREEIGLRVEVSFRGIGDRVFL